MQFTLNRNHTHRSTLGHVLNFRKGEPLYVPPECWKEVVAIGAESSDPAFSAETALLGDEAKAAVPELSAAERAEKITASFPELEKANRRGDFSGGGIPVPKAVESAVGFVVEKREITELWLLYKQRALTEE